MSKIILYTSPTCKACKLAKEYFELKGLAYEERDVRINPFYKAELIQRGYGGVPVIIFNKDGKEEGMFGFDESWLNFIITSNWWRWIDVGNFNY